jgi:putative transcriptional regulator
MSKGLLYLHNTTRKINNAAEDVAYGRAGRRPDRATLSAQPASRRQVMARAVGRIEPVLHNRIAVLRAERGLTRHALAKAVAVNYQTIGYLERGEYNPSLELALRIAEHFGLPVEAIFSRAPFRPMSQQLYQTPPSGDDR